MLSAVRVGGRVVGEQLSICKERLEEAMRKALTFNDLFACFLI